MKNRLKYFDFFTIFNFKEERGRGRCVMILDSIFNSMASYLAMSGTLYTAFLTVNNFSIVDSGILGYLPSLAVVFSLLSPVILERFKRRKWILTIGRICYYTINIVGITLITRYVQDQQAKMTWFCIVIFVSHSFNALTSSGYTVWHLNFIPDNIRVRYFSYSQVLSSLFSGVVLIVSGLIADAVRGTANELSILIILRWTGYLFAVLDIFFLTLPKEYDYPQTGEKINILNTFRFPFREKKFLLTMLIMGIWGFGSALPATWTYYLMNTLQVKVTVINTIDFLYGVVLLLISPFARKLVARLSWFKAFAFSGLLYGITTVCYSFINGAPNKTVMFIVIRLLQHFIAVTLNLGYANFPYINMPKENQTYFFSFYLLMANIVSFSGGMVGTFLVKVIGDRSFTIFGIQHTGPSLMVLVQAGFQLGVSLLVLLLKNKILPNPENE